MDVVASTSSPSNGKTNKPMVNGSGREDGRSQPHRSHKRRNVCLAILAIILIMVLIFVILALTVFKPKHPKTTVNSVSIEDLDLGLSMTSLSVDLNVTLGVDLSIKNPNKMAFKYKNNTALLNYRGDLVGEAPIPAGKISADETKSMNLMLTIMADRLLTKSSLYSDVLAGTLLLNTLTKISGKVTFLGFIKFKVVSTTSCDLTINISSRSVENQKCSYKTKL